MSTSTSKIFADRLSDLIEENRQKGGDYKQISEKTKISTGALSNYANDAQQPNISKLAAIADYFNVSADYLLGLASDPERKPSATDDLGLSAKAVKKILTWKKLSSDDIEPIDFLSQLLESDLFECFMHDLYMRCQVNIAEIVYNSTWTEEFDSTNLQTLKNRNKRIIDIADSGKYNVVVSSYLRQMVRFDQEQDNLEEDCDFYLNNNFGRSIVPQIVEMNTLSIFEALKRDLCTTTSRHIEMQLITEQRLAVSKMENNPQATQSE